MRRCWSESQENACDALLLQRKMAQPAEYGRLLVKVAAQWSAPQSLGLGAVGVQGTYRNLERRILAMTHVKSPSQRRMQLTAWIFVVAGLVGFIPWKLVARAAAPENADGHKPHAVCCAPKPP
jgi:beta-lactamase regulating signal transducer with metallopeptidase domain